MSVETNEKGSILAVDDLPMNLKILTSTLENAGYKILVANSGDRALSQIEHHPPDLILLDILMPGIDGFETCRHLKANPNTANIPVIFMTALTDINSKTKGFEAGAVDYITKPFQLTEMLARIKTHLTISRLQRQLAAQNAQLLEKNGQLETALEEIKRLKDL
ncbi:MAG: response regulator [Chloroflexi bacterium]|nr:response regulator [Chloroflexota bacterium]